MDSIENSEAVTRIFGEWPTFHDAEVLRVVLDGSGADGPTLEVSIHTFMGTGEVTANGHFETRDHTLVTLRFTGVEFDHIGDFSHQNVLFELVISAMDPAQHSGRRFSVDMSASCGMCAEFECVGCAVVAAVPYDVSA
jgi:Immunity protein 50